MQIFVTRIKFNTTLQRAVKICAQLDRRSGKHSENSINWHL